MDWFKELHNPYAPLKDTFYGDNIALYMNVIGGILIGLCFLSIGFVCLVYGKAAAREPGKIKRIFFTQLLGLFLLMCGISRALDVIMYWYNMPYISGIIKVLTGIIAVAAIAYVPVMIKVALQTKTLEEVSKDLEETNSKIEQLKEVTSKVVGGNK